MTLEARSMNTDNHLNTQSAPHYAIRFAQSLEELEQNKIVTSLRLLPAEIIGDIDINTDDKSADTIITIKNMVDGRALACPMPLLKTKVALRDVAVGESLYVIATDSNSRADIAAFCQQTQLSNTAIPLQLVVNHSTLDATGSASFDTIFHFIITKTDSN